MFDGHGRLQLPSELTESDVVAMSNADDDVAAAYVAAKRDDNYDGSFERAQYHGRGVMTEDGVEECGTWEAGVRVVDESEGANAEAKNDESKGEEKAGDSNGDSDGDSDGDRDGDSDGDRGDDSDDNNDSDNDGANDGDNDGDNDGGADDGNDDEASEGEC